MPAWKYFNNRLLTIFLNLVYGQNLGEFHSGFRAYRREVLEAMDLDELSDAGYIFQVDLAWRAVVGGFDVREVPITFTEREIGESKLDGSFVKDSLVEVTRWGVRHRAGQAAEIAKVTKGMLGYEFKHWQRSRRR